MMARSLLLLAFWSGLLGAQTLMYELQGAPLSPGHFASLGEGLALLADVTGDGVQDVALAGRQAQGGFLSLPYLRILSGVDGQVLETVTGFAPLFTMLRCSLAAVGDVNGDGLGDLAVGVWRQTPSVLWNGRVFIFSGADRSLLQTYDGLAPGDDFGWSLAGVGDVNQDGRADVMVGAPQTSLLFGAGYFELHSGLDGSVLMAFGGPASGSQYGYSVGSAGDFDADGTPDLAVGAPTANPSGTVSVPPTGIVQVISGATGQLLATRFGPPGSHFGQSVLGLGDINGDGSDDLAIGLPFGATPGVAVISGLNGLQLYFVSTGFLAGDASVLARVPDLDGDGVFEMLLGNGQPALTTGLARDDLRLLSGQSGAQLLFLPDTGQVQSGGEYRPALVAHPDINGDGVADLLSGDELVGASLEGRLRALSSIPLPTANIQILGPGFAPQGPVPTIVPGVPHLGASLSLSLLHGPPQAMAWLVVSPGLENPLTLTPGLVLYPDLQQAASWLLLPLVTNAAGDWYMSPLTIPLQHGLAGGELVLQAWFPASSGPLGATSSNGYRITLGY